MEISPNILRIEAPLGDRTMALHALMGERVWLVDTGVADTPGRHLLPALREHGVDPSRIAGAVITHCDADHCGGNGELRRLIPHAVFLAHAADVPLIADPIACIAQRYDFEPAYGVPLPEPTRARLTVQFGLPTPVDLSFDANRVELDIGAGRKFIIRHAPGHTAGHVIIHDPQTGAVVLTDAVLGQYLPDRCGRPLFAPTYRHHRIYLQTIEMIRGLRPTLLLPTHFPPIRGREAIECFLDESRDQAESIFARIRGRLSDGVMLSELVAGLGSGLADWVDPESAFLRYSLCYPAAAALDELNHAEKAGA